MTWALRGRMMLLLWWRLSLAPISLICLLAPPLLASPTSLYALPLSPVAPVAPLASDAALSGGASEVGFVTSPAHSAPRCHRPAATCAQLPANATCLGMPLPYDHASTDLAGLHHVSEAMNSLREWQVLKAVPKCWAQVQPLLCSLYLPRCRQKQQESEVFLASRQLCLDVQGPCRIVEEKLQGWPSFFSCNNSDVFSSRATSASCLDEADKDATLSFRRHNSSRGECLKPLLPTDREDSFFDSFDGCGMSCRPPLFTESEYSFVGSWVAALGVIGSVAFLFAAVTQWLSGWHRYPNVVFFYMYISWLLICLSLGMRVIAGDSFVCSDHGTLQGQEGWCTFNFALLILDSSLCWFGLCLYATAGR